MTLLQQIKDDQLAARKGRRTAEATLLTTLIGEVENKALREGKATTDSGVIELVQKFIKNNEDLCKVANPESAAYQAARDEQKFLSVYLPKQLSEAELTEIVNAIKVEISATPKDMGKVMGLLKSRYEGQYDGKVASAVVKAVLI